MARRYIRIGLSFPANDLDDIDSECERLSRLNSRPKRHPFSRCEVVRLIVEDHFKRQREKAREGR